MTEEVYQVLAAGGDVGIWVIALSLFKLEKRISTLEFWVSLLRQSGQIVDTKKAGQ